MPLRKAILEYQPVEQTKEEKKEEKEKEKEEKEKQKEREKAEKARDKVSPRRRRNQERNNPVQQHKEFDMLYELHILFVAMNNSKKKQGGSFDHKRFILAIKATNALFDNDEHHDSHEFINWLLDTVHENFIKNE